MSEKEKPMIEQTNAVKPINVPAKCFAFAETVGCCVENHAAEETVLFVKL